MDVAPSVIQPSSPVDGTSRLIALLEEGRVPQGALRSSDSASTVYGDEAAEIGRWEGKARAALARLRDRAHLRDFENAPGFDGIGLSRGDAYRCMDVQLSALEWAIRDHEELDRDATLVQ